MKSISILLMSLIVLTFFSQCGSVQFDKKAPFTINKAYYQEWFGGKPGSKGMLIKIELAESLSKDVIVDSVFFRNQVSKLDLNIDSNIAVLKGNFVSSSPENRNIIMHSDPREEMVNKVSGKVETDPFELSDNECVISYFIKNKKHYFKIAKLQKEKPVYYP